MDAFFFIKVVIGIIDRIGKWTLEYCQYCFLNLVIGPQLYESILRCLGWRGYDIVCSLLSNGSEKVNDM